MLPTAKLDEPRVVNEDGRIFVDVIWDDAELLRERFVRAGLPGTVILDPVERVARIELWNDADPAEVRTAIAEWNMLRAQEPAQDSELPLAAALAADVVDDLASPAA
jgi:hypothetical protein